MGTAAGEVRWTGFDEARGGIRGRPPFVSAPVHVRADSRIRRGAFPGDVSLTMTAERRLTAARMLPCSPMTIPPSLPASQLPLLELGWERFEKLCRELVGGAVRALHRLRRPPKRLASRVPHLSGRNGNGHTPASRLAFFGE